jgi:hypothetical protein
VILELSAEMDGDGALSPTSTPTCGTAIDWKLHIFVPPLLIVRLTTIENDALPYPTDHKQL